MRAAVVTHHCVPSYQTRLIRSTTRRWRDQGADILALAVTASALTDAPADVTLRGLEVRYPARRLERYEDRACARPGSTASPGLDRLHLREQHHGHAHHRGQQCSHYR